ncbi:MAG: hypothetical protein JWM42_4240 [Burkholderia sp.]|nr:hypothetical protein [Burkholderia sp.]
MATQSFRFRRSMTGESDARQCCAYRRRFESAGSVALSEARASLLPIEGVRLMQDGVFVPVHKPVGERQGLCSFECALPFSDHVHEFDAGQDIAGGSKGLEVERGPGSTLKGTVVLLVIIAETVQIFLRRSLDSDGGFVHPPAAGHRTFVTTEQLFQQRQKPDRSAVDRRVADQYASPVHLVQMPVAEWVCRTANAHRITSSGNRTPFLPTTYRAPIL